MAPGKITNNTERGASNREHSSKYYDKEKFEIQKKRLYNDLANKRRENITQKTIEKYGVEYDAAGKLIVPDRYKPSVHITVEPTAPIDLTVKAPDEVHLVPKVMFKGPVTIKQVQDYYSSGQANEDRQEKGEKQLQANSLKQYGGKARVLVKIGVVSTKNIGTENIIPIINDTDRVIDAIRAFHTKRGNALSTVNGDFHALYELCKSVPMIKDQVTKEVEQKYGKLLGEGKKANANKTYDELQDKPVYDWTQIVDSVDKKFGKDSIQSLYFHVYQEVPIRGELRNLPIVSKPNETNCIVVPTQGPAIVYLKKYKTHAQYKDKEYHLTAGLSDAIRASLKKTKRNILFAINGPLSAWLRDILVKAGFPHFPYGPEHNTHTDIQKAYLGVRHSFLAYANSTHNNGSFEKGHKLASLMLHELQQSLTSYKNDKFYKEEDIKEHQKTKPVVLKPEEMKDDSDASDSDSESEGSSESDEPPPKPRGRPPKKAPTPPKKKAPLNTIEEAPKKKSTQKKVEGAPKKNAPPPKKKPTPQEVPKRAPQPMRHAKKINFV